MRAIRTYGSVRGALSNGRPYRDNAETQCAGHPILTRQDHTKEPAASFTSMPHNRPDQPSLNSKSGCIKAVDTFRAA